MKTHILLAASAGLLAGSATAASAADLVLGVPNWASGTATANILKVVIEENFGLEVDLQNGTNPIIFEAMDRGAMHAHPEVWMPNQASLNRTYVQERGTVVMNANPAQAEQGVCVPDYVAQDHGITSIDDLTDPDKAAIFDGDGDGTPEIWIGAPGWASTAIERIRAKSYGYDQVFELEEFDETIAWGSLATATEAKEPWIGFCYRPHFAFVAYDIRFLDEPPHDPDTWTIVQPTDDPDWLAKSEASTAWKGATLHLHYAKAVEERFPEVAAMFESYRMPAEVLSEAGYALSVQNMDPADFARAWVGENENIVLEWLTR